MKLQILASGVALSILAACSVSTSPSAGGDSGEKAKETPQDPVKPPAPASPFNFSIKQITTAGAQHEYKYAEALDRADGTVELRFFTIPPVTMCNVSTFTDSSSYQTKFKYLKLPIVLKGGDFAVSPRAEVGSRGETWPEAMTGIMGGGRLHSTADMEYSGWLDLQLRDGGKIQGNFNVTHCMKTKVFLEKLSLMGINKQFEMVNKRTGAKYKFGFNSDYRSSSTSYYEGYKSYNDSVSLSVPTYGQDTPYKYSISFGGMPAGKYVTGGNMSCKKSGPGSAVAEIDGNKIHFGSQTGRAFFCESEDGERHPVMVGTIEVVSPILRKVTLVTADGIIEGTF